MADTIVRPTFYEGEILPAADLIGSVDAARGQMARHDRYVHQWGIVTGLNLVAVGAVAGGQAYKIVTVKAGVAIDGTGREIIVPADTRLAFTDFQSTTNPRASTWYPVFLTGQDEPAPPSSNLTGSCNSAQSSKIQENFTIDYGSPGAEINLAQQTAPAIIAGPGDGTSSDAWRILLGFVTWGGKIPEFDDAVEKLKDSGRRYVGVSAAAVVSEGGAVRLATRPADFVGQAAVMAVEVHEDSNGELVFGKQNPDGSIVPLVTMNSKGDITATGKVTGAVTPGSMQVQSGIATDGMIVPLPVGINPADVDAGKVTLFIHVTPRFDQLQGPLGTGPFLPFPFECHVDAVTRQIHCRLQWWDVSVSPPVTVVVLPALCDYTVIAAVAAAGSGS
jgi:hypothetical protein